MQQISIDIANNKSTGTAVSGNVNSVECVLTKLPDGWENLSVFAIFRKDRKPYGPYSVKNLRVTVPNIVLKTGAPFNVGFFAVNSTGEKVYLENTREIKVTVDRGCYRADAVVPDDETKDIFSQYLSILEKAINAEIKRSEAEKQRDDAERQRIEAENIRNEAVEKWGESFESFLKHMNNEIPDINHINDNMLDALRVLYLAVNIVNSSNPNAIAQGSLGVGSGINIERGQSLGVGLNNNVGGYRNVVAGIGLNDYNESCRAIFGRYNKKNGQAVFVVGWGDNDENRKNIFWVEKSGKVRCSGKIYSVDGELATVASLQAVSDELGLLKIECDTKFGSADAFISSLESRATEHDIRLDELRDRCDGLEERIVNIEKNIAITLPGHEDEEQITGES